VKIRRLGKDSKIKGHSIEKGDKSTSDLKFNKVGNHLFSKSEDKGTKASRDRDAEIIQSLDFIDTLHLY
jgi:hypothetical protein